MMLKWVKALLLLCLAGVAAAAGLGYYAMEQLKPAEASEEEIVFTIPPGTSSAGIARILEENGIIRDALIFSYYLKFKDIGTGFQAGTYAMSPGISIQDIIQRLNAGDTVKEETIRVTVPEGYTAEQIMGLLVSAGFSEEELLDILNDPARFQSVPAGADEAEGTLLAGSIPPNEAYIIALEGYLFPETYEFPKDESAYGAVLRMVRELERKLDQLPEGWEKQLEANGVTFHEMMTIASLVEREVVADHERALVAGVIYNRIRSGMPLQIDATVQYALEEPKARLFEKDLQIDSPYNTYKIEGLPPGPIASPGLASIEAALYPEPSEYLYYVTKKDGTGEHYFGKTYNEHLQNIRKSNDNR